MGEKMIQANGVDLCTESFGNPADPALLLIMGATASMLWWDEGFCRRLADRGRHVIRYDNRDTGRSVTYEPGSPPYTLDDMVDDAAGVLDAYGIDRAHLLGMSLGGMIAQLAAIRHPERVLTLTLISSSPHGPEDPDLPPMAEKVLAYHTAGAGLDRSDEATVIDFMVGGWRVLAGTRHPFDEATVRILATEEVKRAICLASSRNHALIQSQRWREQLGEINAPTLVIHGTEDPALPYGHGVALAREIRRARLLTLQRAGHELHRGDWDIVIGAIVQHTAEGARRS
jgi:pimeloyl-ACP methyl ester carboxylesterase